MWQKYSDGGQLGTWQKDLELELGGVCGKRTLPRTPIAYGPKEPRLGHRLDSSKTTLTRSLTGLQLSHS